MSEADGFAGWEDRAEEAHYRPCKLARILGFQEVTLRRVIYKHFGCNLSVRLQELRLERIKQLLKEKWSTKEIASRLGLKQESYLSALFLRETGSTIREYRQALNRGNPPVAVARRVPGRVLTRGTGSAGKPEQDPACLTIFADDRRNKLPKRNPLGPVS